MLTVSRKKVTKGSRIVHSATKWIGGHGTTIAGAIVDAGPSTVVLLFQISCQLMIASALSYQASLTGRNLGNSHRSLNPRRDTMDLSSARHLDLLRSLSKRVWRSCVILELPLTPSGRSCFFKALRL